MNLPPRKPRLLIPVGGARVGSVVRPVEDGASRVSPSARIGLKSNTRSLASLARRDSAPVIVSDPTDEVAS